MRKIYLKIPESWNSLSKAQLTKIAYLSHFKTNNALYDFKIFKALLNIKWWQLKKHRNAKIVFKQVPITTLKNNYNWFYNSVNLTSFIPSIKVKNKTLYAPGNRINNLTIDEFSHADDLHAGWLKTKDFNYLIFLAAILYREQDSKTKKRVVFDKNELENRAKKLNKIHKKTLLAILLSYEGCVNHMTAQFPLIFKKSETKKAQSNGFGKLVLHLSGGKFGTHNETKNTNIYIFLSEFEEQLKQKPYA